MRAGCPQRSKAVMEALRPCGLAARSDASLYSERDPGFAAGLRSPLPWRFSLFLLPALLIRTYGD